MPWPACTAGDRRAIQGVVMTHSEPLIFCALLCAVPAALTSPERPDTRLQSADCRVFALVEANGRVDLQAVPLANHETKVLAGAGVITIIAPVGPGTSGDLVQRSRATRTPIVRCEDGAVRLAFQAPDGTRREYPGVAMAELSLYDIRVNVSSTAGKRAFLVERYETVEAADGPVLDIFAGRIPLQDGDYAITTETKARDVRRSVAGFAPLVFDTLLFATGRFPDGSEAPVIVDLGAGGTVVAKKFLPAGVTITPVESVEYSADGARRQAGQMQGAGGAVGGFLGNATLPTLRVGDIVFERPVVRVLDEMPRIVGREVGAILGLDLIRQGGVVAIGYGGDGTPYLELSSARSPAAELAVLPFSVAANHIFIDGRINAVPVTFMLDTGARGSIASRELAQRAALSPIAGTTAQLRGLDGRPMDVELAMADTVRLARHAFGSVRFHVADLAALAGLGLSDGAAGVIGNDFLRQFQRIELDFDRRTVRLFN